MYKGSKEVKEAIQKLKELKKKRYLEQLTSQSIPNSCKDSTRFVNKIIIP